MARNVSRREVDVIDNQAVAVSVDRLDSDHSVSLFGVSLLPVLWLHVQITILPNYGIHPLMRQVVAARVLRKSVVL